MQILTRVNTLNVCRFSIIKYRWYRHVQRGATWKTATHMCSGRSWANLLSKCYQVSSRIAKMCSNQPNLFFRVRNLPDFLFYHYKISRFIFLKCHAMFEVQLNQSKRWLIKNIPKKSKNIFPGVFSSVFFSVFLSRL